MQRASLQWESAKFCSFMKIRIVWLQISSSLSVAVQLYPTFLPILKKWMKGHGFWWPIKHKIIFADSVHKNWHFWQGKYNEDQNKKLLWEPLLSLKRIAADALLLRRWCCFASVGFEMSLRKKSKRQLGLGFVSIFITSSNLCYQ